MINDKLDNMQNKLFSLYLRLVQKIRRAIQQPKYAFNKATDPILKYVIGVPVVIVMRLLYPLFHIRVGTISIQKMGIFAFHFDNYLMDERAGRNRKKFDLIGMNNYTPINRALLRLVKKQITFFPFARIIDNANNLFRNAEKYKIPLRGYDHDRERKIFPALIKLDSKIIQAGEAWLKKVGIEKTKK